jgi:hypothetical protein
MTLVIFEEIAEYAFETAAERPGDAATPARMTSPTINAYSTNPCPDSSLCKRAKVLIIMFFTFLSPFRKYPVSG